MVSKLVPNIPPQTPIHYQAIKGVVGLVAVVDLSFNVQEVLLLRGFCLRGFTLHEL